jgi:hypothetical protein
MVARAQERAHRGSWVGWNIERLSHRTRRPIGGYRVLGGAGQKEVQQGESHPVRARRPRKLEEHMAKATKKKRPQVAEALKSKNTSREDLQADEAVGWRTASASPEAGHRPLGIGAKSKSLFTYV